MKSNKRILLILFLLCLSPVIFSWLIYIFKEHIPLQTANRGELLHPVRDMSFMASAQAKWQVLYMPLQCNEKDAKNIMSNLESVRKLLGEKENRVSLALLLNKRCEGAAPSFQQIIVTQQQIANLQLEANHIYLADPRQQLFMEYVAQVDPLDIYQDLKRVVG